MRSKILDCTKVKIVLFAQLNNKNAFYIDIHEEVYSEEKQEFLKIKLNEHKNVVAATHDRKDEMPQNDFKKALENLDRDKIEILNLRYRMLGGGFHNKEISDMDICLQRPLVLTVSQADQTIRLWNYITNQCDLIKNFNKFDKETGKISQSPLRCAALHPSGFYIAVGCTDFVELYHVLHQDLREFKKYEVKQCKKIAFSQGGQYLVVVDNKQIRIYSTFTLEKIEFMVCPSQNVSQIAFNEDDSVMTFTSYDGFLQRFDLKTMRKMGESFIDRNCEMNSCIFLTDEKDKQKVVGVGCDKDVGGILRIYNKDEDTELKLNFEKNVALTDICLVNSAKLGIQNFVTSTSKGSLQVLGLPPNLKSDLKH